MNKTSSLGYFGRDKSLLWVYQAPYIYFKIAKNVAANLRATVAGGIQLPPLTPSLLLNTIIKTSLSSK